MADILKTCPFCGGSASITFDPEGTRDAQGRLWAYNAVCDRCCATSGLCFSKQMVIDAWNKRVKDGSTSDNVEDARDLLKSVLLHSGSLCMYCKHYLPCRRNACPHFKEQVGYDEKLPDGSIKHHPHYSRRLCEGRDGMCDAKIGTPCDGCVQGSGWDFSLSVDREDRLNPM